MTDASHDALAQYVSAAAHLTEMPMSAERLSAVTTVMTRVASFAADLGVFALADEVEIAGVFTP